MNFSYLFLLFIIYSVIGWVMEVIYTYCKEKAIVNRGFLMGPYCPIYGTGCILMLLLLKRYIDDLIALFVMSMVICALLEYLTSFIMEKLFKARWWDYSDRKFNINGRICLETLIPFGILGCLLMYVLNPFILEILDLFPKVFLDVLASVAAVLFILDFVTSYAVITRLHISTKGIIGDNTEEITKRVKEYLSKNSRFGRRLTKSFPGLKVLKERYNKKDK